MKHSYKRKAQVWSLDFIVSLVLFMSVLGPLFFVWSYVNTQSQQQILFERTENLALSISDSLVRSMGLPEGWNETSVSVIGLASDDNILNSTKVSYFFSMGASDYNRTKAILTGGYDFFLNLTDINGTVQGTIGSKDASRTFVPIERYCIYNERVTKLEFALVI